MPNRSFSRILTCNENVLSERYHIVFKTALSDVRSDSRCGTALTVVPKCWVCLELWYMTNF